MKVKLSKILKEYPVSFVEILIGLVVIGIIVFASFPKFSHITIQARNASNEDMVNALKSAISAAHATWVSSGASNALAGTYIILNGQQFHVNSFGWPDNGKNVTPEPDDCAIIWSSILSNPPIAGCEICEQTCTLAANNGCYVASATGSICKFSLATNSHITITYNISNGSIGSTSE